MSDEKKQKVIDEIIKGFDFELVRSTMYLMGRDRTTDKLEKVARRLLEKVMEHTDREFWYAGTGCLCAYYDDINGAGLCFIPERSRVTKSEL
jgi:benzoyl-CoA reductase/2-hydroxyglutaryl-CoA dehydratase subunit BcrC/BadD/HgdB